VKCFRLVRTLDRLRGDNRGWILVVTASGWLIVLGARFIIPVLLPDVMAEFDISTSVAGLAMTILLGCYAVMQFPAGLLTDHSGERTTLLASMVLSAVSIVLFLVTPVFAVFLIACALFGVGTGMFAPPRVTLLSNTFPENDRFAYGVTFSAGNLGTAVLPVCAGMLAAAFDWRYGIGFTLPFFVCLMLGIWVFVPSSSTKVRNAMNKSVPHTLRRTTGSVTSPGVLVAGSGMTLILFVYQGLTAFLPTYLITSKDLSPRVATLLFSLYFLVGGMFQPFAGYAADRYGDRRILLVLSGLVALSLFFLPFVTGILPLAVLVGVMGARAGIPPVNNAYLVAAVPEDVQGAGYGLVRSTYILIGSTGSFVVGLFGDAGLFDVAFLFLGCLAVVAAVVYGFLPQE
jgi:MFS family permease